MSTTMKAVVFHGPQKVAIEDRPIPNLIEPEDVIVKVTLTALCGRWAIIDFERGENVS